MKKSIYSLFIAAIVSLTAVCAQAAEAASEAVVLKVTGSPVATVGGQQSAIKVGDKLAQGTVITTSDTSEVELRAFSGSTTTIKPSTTAELSKLSLTTDGGAVTKQSAVIDLKVGNVVSKLDPSKKAINDYSIRTPKGVAAARGTVYVVTVSPSGVVTLKVTAGAVIFNTPSGQVTVLPGQQVTVQSDGSVGPVEASQAAEEGSTSETKDNNSDTNVIDPTIASPSSQT
ncbi:FecR family protein [Rariglobus hedericola]|uniref:FecR protein domain-containing protein n=1 Tax=Rariglobus hedericola TaxID=2597822 RepID=A0A556QPB3_9BACT|nr:FecR domain-containing protein [Rariglobus hedericola]TSJ78475.1 hypothetical protein FPL22_04015 [Rariglobus hedericola]